LMQNKGPEDLTSVNERERELPTVQTVMGCYTERRESCPTGTRERERERQMIQE
jgi:hypothetical protein